MFIIIDNYMSVKNFCKKTFPYFVLLAILGLTFALSCYALGYYEGIICFAVSFPIAYLNMLCIVYYTSHMPFKKFYIDALFKIIRLILTFLGLLIPALLINFINGNFLYIIESCVIITFAYLILVLSTLGDKETGL